MTEYVKDGVLLGNTVTIDGITYPKSAFASLPGVLPVRPTPTVTNDQVIDWLDGEEIDGEWVRFAVRLKTDAEKLAEIRRKRDSLLAATDVYALSDRTLSPEMTAYRQALRDLPETVDINNPVFPIKPE